MENKLQYRLIKKFGPSIFHVRIPEDILTKLNNYADQTIKDEKKIKGLEVGKNLAYRGGNLQLIHGSRMFLCHSTLDLVPSVGDFYFFPNYLMHTVFPFKDTNEERRSISFNALVDDEIYNVYGR